MRKRSTFFYINQIGKQIFTTRELSMVSGRSLSAATQSLNNMAREGTIAKIRRGVWARADTAMISPYGVIPYLFSGQRVYVSFISALHLHGIIEQIPQVITLASTAHSNIINTSVGIFHTYRINPSFFSGFGWYKENGGFLIAEPEKALVDCLYLSAHKKRRFSYFPELTFPGSFSIKKVRRWIEQIPSRTTRAYAAKKLRELHITQPT
jgi:predicted transcriptional regulator of viral defense system